VTAPTRNKNSNNNKTTTTVCMVLVKERVCTLAATIRVQPAKMVSLKNIARVTCCFDALKNCWVVDLSLII
jgi:hypothetical protein